MNLILRENEEIIKTVREDSTILLPRVLIWLFIFLLVCFWKKYTDFDFFGYFVEVMAFFLVLGIIAILWKILLWSRSRLILTNLRLVCHAQDGIFSKRVIELLIKDIQEISYEHKGLGSTLLHYGDLKIKTASDSNHVFERIRHPQDLVEIINTHR